jgi:hypothetical protein
LRVQKDIAKLTCKLKVHLALPCALEVTKAVNDGAEILKQQIVHAFFGRERPPGPKCLILFCYFRPFYCGIHPWQKIQEIPFNNKNIFSLSGLHNSDIYIKSRILC